jgi:beta-glucanase (GH16 family)
MGAGPPPRGPWRRPWVTPAAAVFFAACLVAVGFAAFGSAGSAPSLPPGVAQAASPTTATLGGGTEPSSAAAPDAGTVPAVPAGYTQVFLDNFGGAAGSRPSGLNWFYDIGTNWGNEEIDTSTDSTSNVYLDGQGDLVVQANEKDGKWTSGRIETARDDFIAPPGGKLEMTASIEQPDVANGTGYWPAFWALGSPERSGGEWPETGELDMLEDVNGDNKVTQTIHDGGATKTTGLISCPAVGCQDGFNTYSVIIDRTSTDAEFLQFLLDGKVEKTITEAEVGTAVWQAAIDHAFYIILNMAIGGSYPDEDCECTSPTSSTTSGGSMKVAYVAVYEQGGNSTPTATATTSGEITGYQGGCLDNANSLDTSYNPIIIDSCDATDGQQSDGQQSDGQQSDGQQWATYSDGTLRSQGGCLDTVDEAGKSGTGTQWWPCTGAKSQVWQHESNGELYNPNSGLCLTNPSDYNDTPLVISACQDTPQQKWQLPS